MVSTNENLHLGGFYVNKSCVGSALSVLHTVSYNVCVKLDRSGADAQSEHINYSDPQIGLKLPIPVSENSDYDQNAPFVF